MNFLDALIALAVLIGLAIVVRAVRKSWGPLEGVAIILPGDAEPKRRTPGEIQRELWEQKGTLDRAIENTAAATLAQHNAKKLKTAQATPVRGWHAPDAPCEVEQ
ncbi:MAG TPA: hypothetical protein VJ549_00575 [Geothrix sp.]|nr:hypothetical protein [Geothrix sp.]HJV47742.1 hypothetical protein [Geothrix sp.]